MPSRSSHKEEDLGVVVWRVLWVVERSRLSRGVQWLAPKIRYCKVITGSGSQNF